MADVRCLSIGVAQCLRACVLFLVISYGRCLNLNTACIEVKKAYAERGFDENEVPITAISGADLSICLHTETCCTRSMEDKLTSLSRKDHARQLDESFKMLKSNFASRTKKFDDFFTELLENARNDLHEMFVKTYGLLYQQNAQIFTQLFDDLRGYYKGKDKNLVDVMDNFFSKLLQRMFELLNVDYQFDDDYLGCVTERMNDLKPFGDVPQKLSLHIKRSFIAARTFVQGLAIGRDVVTTVMEIAPSDACVKAIVRMTYCPYCRGLTSTKPCSNYCLNTMKGCFAHQADLNDAWNAYIDALNMLAGRLEGPFNIESVVDPIDVKISEAIMNLQENAEKVRSQIFSGCGTPRLSRKRRETETQKETDSQRYTFEFPKTSQVRPTTAAGTSLDRLVRDIKERVKTAKDFWVRLPYAVCNDVKVAADASKEDDCWNGQDRARYVPEVQKDGVLHQINNPEVEVDVTKVNSVVNRQLLQLQVITNKLQNAYKGEDVDWIDTEIDGLASGSGSGDYPEGSGSGAGVVTDDEKEGIVNIDENPNHGTANKANKNWSKSPGSNVDQAQWPTRKETEDDHGIQVVEEPNKRGQETGRGKGEERKDDRRRGGRGDSAACISLSASALLLAISLHYGLRHLLLC